MRIIVLMGSPNRTGSTNILVENFVNGAEEAGHSVEQVYLYDKEIGFCRACYACFKTGKCVLQDEPAESTVLFGQEEMNNIQKRVARTIRFIMWKNKFDILEHPLEAGKIHAV